MGKGLDKQVFIYSLSTESFYTDVEMKIHNKLSKYRTLKKKVGNKIKRIDEELRSEIHSTEEVGSLHNRKINLKLALNKIIKYIDELKIELKYLLNNHKGIRHLNEDSLHISKIIGMFDSTLTRTLGMKVDMVSMDIVVVRVYYYQVLENLISDGFIYKGEKYIYFSSSAGQIRTKKGVWIKEFQWEKHKNTLTCGLDIEEINGKGGCNVNKLLAYKALSASASQEWSDFDIDKTIVVPDLETKVTSLFDYINRDTYEIKRQEMSIPIEHTDGCGMILSKKSKKAFMVRLPFVKGLLVPFPFDVFAKENGNTKITDIYGKEWDIVEDQIQVIFTASQFKMKKYYEDWNDYKQRFKKFNCRAAKLNEEDIGADANLNYQMLQTLTDMTNSELKEIAKPTIESIHRVGNDKETMLRILGATKENKRKNYYQSALSIYPELLNDEHSKKIIKDKKKSMVRDAVSGKLKVNGKYIYLIPDLYAFCERLFLGSEQPKGLLKNGQIYCNIHQEGKVDILRSPHLYKEHCVRQNTLSDEKFRWFITNGIYTSIHDPISRILQADFDGDQVIVIQDKLFIDIAERNMENIVPLYYEMGVANPEKITDKKILDSLLMAFKANIGEVSNNITKVFNSNNIDLRVVKWLAAENNYIIDFAKTLYMPTRPEWVDEIIKKYIKSKVPYFFIEAKDKDKHKVEPINRSTVNRIRKIIPNRKIKFEEVAGHFDYKMLMSEEIEYLNKDIIKRYEELDRGKKWILKNLENTKSYDKMYIYKYISDEMKKVHSDENRIVNVLVEYLYNRKNSSFKDTLWWTYGNILLFNLKQNIKGTKQCECCGARIEVESNRAKYCPDCWKEREKELWRQSKRKQRSLVQV